MQIRSFKISKKNKLDQYYTKPEVAAAFSDVVKGLCGDAKFIEPSAGTGNFSMHFDGIVSYDLSPKFEGCIEQDFLKVQGLPKGCVFVGNPPFGFCSRLALAFINKCAKLDAKAICFILPRTFKKSLFQNKIDQNYHLVYSKDLERNSFILDDEEYDVPCVFQIWERKDGVKREVITADESVYFEVTSKQEATHAIRRVGSQAGKILNGTDHSESTTYFVKMTKCVANLVNTYYDKIKEEASLTAGVRSITLKEIAHILNCAKQNQC